ncbi:PIN domain-like protein [Ampelomyces quisqualis]|uniref:PIN domain-like protein n=1 Tax=Ampelomyces quisqualis TaxID=50730 RepID=A0A6A5QG66_AMPQU|nr:PIN domain-like protein [Ampelomyces quisqualis]
MGIPELRSTIEACEEIIPIAQLAEQHYRDKGRPLKIAIDEADWRFNNVSPQQVAAIRRSVPEANPVEKAMFYRICNLLTANVELVFVFDGPCVPAKHGRPAGGRKVSPKDRELLKETLKHFGIPAIDAPGEAEAECCHLAQLGIVDAVWSQDSDCLMFGCQLWLRDDRIPREAGYDNRNKGHTKKAAKTVRVVRADILSSKHRLRREGCVLFAMLAGGDYDRIGLARCGAATALKAAQSGLGVNLCNAKSQEDCDKWKTRVLLPFFKRENIQIVVPVAFPKFSTLQSYNRPNVLSDASVLENPELAQSSRRSINEVELLKVTSHRYNTWGKGYMDWVVPTLLTRTLADMDDYTSHELVHQIQLVQTRKKQGDNSMPLERKITFSPFSLTKLRQLVFEGLMPGYWCNKPKKSNEPKKPLFEPNYRVECEIPTYLLRKVVPPEILDLAPTVAKGESRKRKVDTQASNRGSKIARKNTITIDLT